MFHFPPIPTWDAIHPLVVHFPVALLLLSPLFILIGAVLAPPRGQPYRIAGLLILILGTISLFVAASSGEAAGELAERGGGVDAVLAAHERLASETRILFSVLSGIFLAMTLLPKVARGEETRLSSTFMPMAFLILYSVGILFLANTAHAGGRLVHEFGVHAVLPPENSPQGMSAVENAAVDPERN